MDTPKRRNLDVFTRVASHYEGYFSDEEQNRLDEMSARIGFGPGKWIVDFSMGTAAGVGRGREC